MILRAEQKQLLWRYEMILVFCVRLGLGAVPSSSSSKSSQFNSKAKHRIIRKRKRLPEERRSSSSSSSSEEGSRIDAIRERSHISLPSFAATEPIAANDATPSLSSHSTSRPLETMKEINFASGDPSSLLQTSATSDDSKHTNDCGGKNKKKRRRKSKTSETTLVCF